MNKELRDLCFRVKKEIENGNYETAFQFITDSMKNYPNSGVPHNLMGILEEYRRNHIGAMKHFRAAWALEPTLLSARWNLDVFGTDSRRMKCAFLDEDVPEEQDKTQYKWVYDEKGIGHLVRREEK